MHIFSRCMGKYKQTNMFHICAIKYWQIIARVILFKHFPLKSFSLKFEIFTGNTKSMKYWRWITINIRDVTYLHILPINSLFQDYTKQSFSRLQTLKKDYRDSFSGLLNPPSLSHGAPASLLYTYLSTCLILWKELYCSRRDFLVQCIWLLKLI